MEQDRTGEDSQGRVVGVRCKQRLDSTLGLDAGRTDPETAGPAGPGESPHRQCPRMTSPGADPVALLPSASETHVGEREVHCQCSPGKPWVSVA